MAFRLGEPPKDETDERFRMPWPKEYFMIGTHSVSPTEEPISPAWEQKRLRREDSKHMGQE